MAIRRKKPEIPAGEPKEQPAPLPAAGDHRGAYGYGRPAHGPDPSGVYSFRPEKTRTLPTDKAIRWKVTG